MSPPPYDGLDDDHARERFGVPRFVAFDTITSTLDVAHDLANEGAPAGTLVIADAQTHGRGRAGRSWRSEPGAGIWLTLVERPGDARALDVMSLRVGLALAEALDGLAGGTITLKWPNDLIHEARKLGGVLVEARWREGVPEWVAIGVGINVRSPSGEPGAIGLPEGTRRLDVLDACVPAIRRAAACTGPLGADELHAYAVRDAARGRPCVSPAVGVVRGIDECGALLVDIGSETIAMRSGSLVFPEEP